MISLTTSAAGSGDRERAHASADAARRRRDTAAPDRCRGRLDGVRGRGIMGVSGCWSRWSRVRQVIVRFLRKLVRIGVGLALLVAGAVMLITPGQGLLCILLGFLLLRKEVPWVDRRWRAIRRRLPPRWVAWGDQRKARLLALWQRSRWRAWWERSALGGARAGGAQVAAAAPRPQSPGGREIR